MRPSFRAVAGFVLVALAIVALADTYEGGTEATFTDTASGGMTITITVPATEEAPSVATSAAANSRQPNQDAKKEDSDTEDPVEQHIDTPPQGKVPEEAVPVATPQPTSSTPAPLTEPTPTPTPTPEPTPTEQPTVPAEETEVSNGPAS